jgi:hypothetical protein
MKKTLLNKITSAITLVPKQSQSQNNTNVVDAEVIPQGEGISPSLPGLVKVFENAPEAEGLFASHFGINLSQLAGMTPEELGKQTDIILQAKQFAEYLPIIEDHIKDYVQAVTDYNVFIANCIKAGAKGIKEIDKAKVDVMLEWFGYKAHQEQLGRKADNEKIKIKQETDNYITLSDFNLDMALKIKAAALQKSMDDAQQRPLLQAEQAKQKEIVKERKQAVKNLIQYGTADRGK